MSDVFISYQREDEAIARSLADLLIARGAAVWWDNDLKAGEDFQFKIDAAIRAARVVVVLWSPRSVVSDWVRGEASYARQLGKHVFPVTVDSDGELHIPLPFRTLHTADLAGWTGDKRDPRLGRVLDDLLSLMALQNAGGPHSSETNSTRQRPVPARRSRRLSWPLIVGGAVSATGVAAASALALLYPASLERASHLVLGEPFGTFVILVADEEGDPDKPSRGILELKLSNGQLWGTRYLGPERYRYSYTGYIKNGHVVLAYRSDELARNGFGTYILAGNSASGNEYVGVAQVNTCSPEGQSVMQCNAVLVRASATGAEAADTLGRHRGLLAEPCTTVRFHQSLVTARLSCPQGKLQPAKTLLIDKR